MQFLEKEIGCNHHLFCTLNYGPCVHWVHVTNVVVCCSSDPDNPAADPVLCSQHPVPMFLAQHSKRPYILSSARRRRENHSQVWYLYSSTNICCYNVYTINKKIKVIILYN